MTLILKVSEEQFLERISTYLDPEDRLKVLEALAFARQKHGDAIRKSGERFYIHPLTVAYYLAEYHLDFRTLQSALLHDVAEDEGVPISEIAALFGREVANLVDGVTKLKDVSEGVSDGKRLTKQEIQDLSTEKLLLEMVKDVRVVIIKLFDRLHNMRTINAMSEAGQKRKARETLYVFAPLADRLGMWSLKSELEARCLEILEPGAYEHIKRILKAVQDGHQELYQIVSGQIMDYLLEANIDVRKIVPEPENIYSVYQDLLNRGAAYDAVDRTMRLTVLVDEWTTCYTALGHLHNIWSAVPHSFDDYISVPRINLYRSLHTTVIHDSGMRFKIRIRTESMDKVAKIGILASWYYAGSDLWEKGIADRINVLSQNIQETISAEYLSAAASVRSVVEDIFRAQISVYTPQGELKQLADGATPIDFAYAVHTDIGNQCQGAYINDQLSPLNRPLRNGDKVQIIKGLRAEPHREWLDEDLNYLATNYARSHARRWFRRLTRKTAIVQGKELLTAELLMLGMPHHSRQGIARSFGFENRSALYHALGRAEILPTVVATRVLDEIWADEPLRNLDNVVVGDSGERFVIRGADRRRLRLCATCRPQPRDNIIGYLRKNGVVSVHKEDCHSLLANRIPERLLQVVWGAATTRKARLITIQVDVYDRPGLLFDITNLMKDEQMNISHIYTPRAERAGEMRIILSLEVVRPRQAVRILHQIRALVNVFSVRCLPNEVALNYDGAANPFYIPE